MSVSVFPFTIVLISVVFDVMTSVFFRHMLYNCYRWDFEQGATFPWSHTIDSSLLRKMYGSSYGKQVEFWCRLVKMQVFAGCRFQLHVLGTRRGQVSLLNFERPKNIVTWFRSVVGLYHITQALLHTGYVDISTSYIYTRMCGQFDGTLSSLCWLMCLFLKML